MKDEGYVELICKGFCRFYKEGKEELHCGTYVFLRNNLTAAELHSLLKLFKPPAPEFSKDSAIKEMVCDKCDFLVDGCDFRDNESGPPCGGYAILEKLLS
ncbi:MAG: hypothetical protein AB1553_09265 [Nitrospirota bacterium]